MLSVVPSLAQGLTREPMARMYHTVSPLSSQITESEGGKTVLLLSSLSLFLVGNKCNMPFYG